MGMSLGVFLNRLWEAGALQKVIIPVDLKNSHNLEVESYVLFGENF